MFELEITDSSFSPRSGALNLTNYHPIKREVGSIPQRAAEEETQAETRSKACKSNQASERETTMLPKETDSGGAVTGKHVQAGER